MSEPFLSELRCVSFNFAPKGWTMANGQTMSIQQNAALFALVGTLYGGNGQTTFQLPNLQGSVPVHRGTGFSLGQKGGETAHTLTMQEMPSHIHFAQGINTPYTNPTPPSNNFLCTTPSALTIYGPAPNTPSSMNVNTITLVGGSQPHPNQSPYLVLTWIIALTGIFPTQS